MVKNQVNPMLCIKEEFEQMIENGELLEYQIVHGFYYGTPKNS